MSASTRKSKKFFSAIGKCDDGQKIKYIYKNLLVIDLATAPKTAEDLYLLAHALLNNTTYYNELPKLDFSYDIEFMKAQAKKAYGYQNISDADAHNPLRIDPLKMIAPAFQNALSEYISIAKKQKSKQALNNFQEICHDLYDDFLEQKHYNQQSTVAKIFSKLESKDFNRYKKVEIKSFAEDLIVEAALLGHEKAIKEMVFIDLEFPFQVNNVQNQLQQIVLQMKITAKGKLISELREDREVQELLTKRLALEPDQAAQDKFNKAFDAKAVSEMPNVFIQLKESAKHFFLSLLNQSIEAEMQRKKFSTQIISHATENKKKSAAVNSADDTTELKISVEEVKLDRQHSAPISIPHPVKTKSPFLNSPDESISSSIESLLARGKLKKTPTRTETFFASKGGQATGEGLVFASGAEASLQLPFAGTIGGNPSSTESTTTLESSRIKNR